MPGNCVRVMGASSAASRSGKPPKLYSPRGELGGELRLVSMDTMCREKVFLVFDEAEKCFVNDYGG